MYLEKYEVTEETMKAAGIQYLVLDDISAVLIIPPMADAPAIPTETPKQAASRHRAAKKPAGHFRARHPSEVKPSWPGEVTI